MNPSNPGRSNLANRLSGDDNIMDSTMSSLNKDSNKDSFNATSGSSSYGGTQGITGSTMYNDDMRGTLGHPASTGNTEGTLADNKYGSVQTHDTASNELKNTDTSLDTSSQLPEEGGSIAPKIIGAAGAVTGAVGQAVSATANAIYNVVAGPGPVTTGTGPGTEFYDSASSSSTYTTPGQSSTNQSTPASRADEGPFLQGVRSGAEATRNAPHVAADMAHTAAVNVVAAGTVAKDAAYNTAVAAKDTAYSAAETAKQAGAHAANAVASAGQAAVDKASYAAGYAKESADQVKTAIDEGETGAVEPGTTRSGTSYTTTDMDRLERDVSGKNAPMPFGSDAPGGVTTTTTYISKGAN